MNQLSSTAGNGPVKSPFIGGGQMGERIRQYDWDDTPLGPVINWPQSLKTAINIMLASRFPMMIHWGKELIHFYNDGYATILQSKHPGALGEPAQPWWSEMWDFLTPIFNQVLSGETTYFENSLVLPHRRGFLEECYFTFSHSPLYDENGQVGGIFVTAMETSESVITQRRLALLSELGTHTNQAVSLEAVTGTILDALRTNSYDIPFALFYLQEGGQLRLAGQVGFSGSIHLTKQNLPWYEQWLTEQILPTREPQLLSGLPKEWDSLPGGPWPEQAREAFLMPLPHPNADAGGNVVPYGFMLLGISPRRYFDEAYRSFFTLIGKHTMSALNNATAYQQERQRVIALSQLDEAKNVFFSNITHELRTPLTLMLGPVADVLNGQLPQATRNLLKLAQHNGLRLRNLITSLLDFSRLQAGRLQPQVQPVDLAALTANIASTFRQSIEGAGLRFLVDCQSLPQPVYVDPHLWERIIFNLLSNAFNFTLSGEIRVILVPTDNGASLHISDTGTGIAAEHLTEIFTRFYRIEGAKARVHEGSGIGLAMVAELVKLHGGKISVHSEVGRGSEFILTMPYRYPAILGEQPVLESALPIQPEHREYLPSILVMAGILSSSGSEPDNTIPPASTDNELPVILLVEDNADMRWYLEGILKPFYQVIVASDGKQAVEILSKEKADMVISDVMMPHLNGYTLVETIRSQEHIQTLPVLLLSARTGEEARIKSIQSGADQYLEKPFGRQELLARVEMMLDLAHKRKVLLSQQQRAYKESEQARHALTLQHQHLTQANQRLDGFVHMVAHDLKGPVTNAKQLMEWLIKSSDISQREQLLDLLQLTISRLDSTLQGLISIIQLQTDTGIVAKRESFSAVLQTVEWELQDSLQESGGRLQANFSALDTVVYPEPYLLSILRNIVSNALKYRSHKRTPLIQLQTRRVGNYVEISISDNGQGIDLTKHGDALFAPFKRLTSYGEGSGLGLHLVKTMVEQNGGYIDVESQPGIGTAFKVYLKEY